MFYRQTRSCFPIAGVWLGVGVTERRAANSPPPPSPTWPGASEQKIVQKKSDNVELVQLEKCYEHLVLLSTGHFKGYSIIIIHN